MAKLSSIAFVLPWYGPEVPGGAEADARHTAEHLRAAGAAVEVWTTCAQRFDSDWNQDFFQPGRSIINGVPVTRFPVTPAQRDRYWALHRRLAFGGRVTPREEALFLTQSIRSRALCNHIRSQKKYICVFTPYLYGTTYWGAYVSPERCILIPCLHDEGFARLRAMRHLFRSARGIVCNSKAEMRLVQRLYGVSKDRLAEKGAGITLKARGNAQVFRDRYGISGPFLLYAGRKSQGKNTPLLLTYFRRYHRRRSTSLQLVLIGEGRVQIPSGYRHVIRDLGYIPERDKLGAFAAATVFCQPSVNESFSIVLLEAWVQGTAALVNARCAVTREHCQRAGGGLYFNGYQEFEAALDLLLSDDVLREKLGECGRRYVQENYTWEQVTDRFLRAISVLGQ